MRYIFSTFLILSLAGLFLLYSHNSAAMDNGDDLMNTKPTGYPEATFAGGCFWCLESEFRALDGVLYTESGYEGGTLENPTYKDITTGKTGHAEVVRVTYDPEKVSYGNLVDFFILKAHDPTQVNRQGVDVGTQYRSAIFYNNDDQQQIAEARIQRAEDNKVYNKPIATRIEPSTEFWIAEDYHQQYYEKYEALNGQPHIRVLLKKSKKALLGK